jgi:hypothetical protein
VETGLAIADACSLPPIAGQNLGDFQKTEIVA